MGYAAAWDVDAEFLGLGLGPEHWQAAVECAVARLLVEEAGEWSSYMVAYVMQTEEEVSKLPAADPVKAQEEGIGQAPLASAIAVVLYLQGNVEEE